MLAPVDPRCQTWIVAPPIVLRSAAVGRVPTRLQFWQPGPWASLVREVRCIGRRLSHQGTPLHLRAAARSPDLRRSGSCSVPFASGVEHRTCSLPRLPSGLPSREVPCRCEADLRGEQASAAQIPIPQYPHDDKERGVTTGSNPEPKQQVSIPFRPWRRSRISARPTFSRWRQEFDPVGTMTAHSWIRVLILGVRLR
jgi:hypothetical protein